MALQVAFAHNCTSINWSVFSRPIYEIATHSDMRSNQSREVNPTANMTTQTSL